MTEKRLLILFCCVFAFATLVEIKMASLICSDYYILAEKQTVRSVDISTGRADIVDCNLKKITGTENEIKAFITSEKDLQNIYENIREEDRPKFYSQIQRQRQVVVNLSSPIQSEEIYTTSKRYSAVNPAQHIVGYLDNDGNGIAGIERAYNHILKDSGEKITVHFNVNGNGDIYGDVYSTVSQSSQVLSLTIDNRLQRIREGIAKENIPNGSIVIMESRTGKIKAMASTPIYDANNIVDYLDGENSPLLNKAIQSYEPGSVIKPLWAATMIEQGYNKDRIYYCKGYTTINGHTYHCANNRAHGEITMEDALVVSCNCYFVDAQYNNKGLIMCQSANQVNFGDSIQLCDDYFTVSGDFPSTEKMENMGVLSSTCFGQGNFRVTPVHIASYMNIFANDGVYISPQIVQGIYNQDSGALIEKIYEFDSKKVFTTDTAQTVKEMLVQVVEQGAAARAKPEFLSGSGKTGTAQTGQKKENGEEILTAWFCGFYPAENPKYTICITMYDGGESTYSAAPLFKKVCDSLYYLDYCY